MMNDLQRKAREKSLQDLTGAMDEDDMKPLLTIRIETSGGQGSEPEGNDPMGEEGPMGTEGDESLPQEPDGDESMMGGEDNPFMELLRKKMMEKMGK